MKKNPKPLGARTVGVVSDRYPAFVLVPAAGHEQPLPLATMAVDWAACMDEIQDTPDSADPLLVVPVVEVYH
jgi:hypothetical protein